MLKAEVEATLLTRHSHHFLLLAASSGTFIGEDLKETGSARLVGSRAEGGAGRGPFSFSGRGPICSPCRCVRPL